MSFKLQMTDEMTRFIRDSDRLTDADAGRLIRMLLDVADGIPVRGSIPQPLTHTLPIFVGQIERFRASYERSKASALERQRRSRERIAALFGSRGVVDGDESLSRVTAVTPRDMRDTSESASRASRVTSVTPRDMRDTSESASRASRVTAVTPRDMRDHCDERENSNPSSLASSPRSSIPHHTIPDHESTDSTLVAPARERAHTRGRSESESGRVGIDRYEDCHDLSRDPVELAVAFCLEDDPKKARRSYRRQFTRIGEYAFRQELARFWGEVNAGEEPRNRGAAFTARLKTIETFDAEEAGKARQAIAALSRQNQEENTP